MEELGFDCGCIATGEGDDFDEVWANSNEGAMGVGFFQYICTSLRLTEMTVLIVVVSFSIFNFIAVCDSELALGALFCQFKPFGEMFKNPEHEFLICASLSLFR